MKLRILLVDDEPGIKSVYQRFFEERGHEVISAPNPTLLPVCYERKCAPEFPCADMVLIDFRMPKMNGLDFLQMQKEKGCKAPSENKIIMTGMPGDLDVEQVKALGCQVLNKPLTFAELDDLLTRVESNLSPDRQLADLSYNP